MWKYYRNGKLVKECNDLPETVEDAVIELQENGYDVSNCVIDDREEPCDDTKVCNTYNDTGDCNCDDFWSPDYPSEEDEYKDTMTFKPLTPEEEKAYFKAIKSLKGIKAPKGFQTRLYDRIERETGVSMKPSRLNSIKSWWINVTTGEKVYLSFWLIFLYLLVGLVTQDMKIVRIVCEIMLWPLFL